MTPIDGSDAAIGWALIVAMGLAVYIGVPRFVAFVVRAILEDRDRRRAERERIQEELDDAFRDELFMILENERAAKERERGGDPG